MVTNYDFYLMVGFIINCFVLHAQKTFRKRSPRAIKLNDLFLSFPVKHNLKLTLKLHTNTVNKILINPNFVPTNLLNEGYINTNRNKHAIFE